MKTQLLVAALGATTLLASCSGAGPETPLAVERLSGAQAAPPAAAVAATLAAVADSPTAQRRVGYVNTQALAALGGKPDAGRITELVLGAPGAARVTGASAPPRTAVQIGDATVLFQESRTVVGGAPALRAQLAVEVPKPNLIEDETPSALQSCLGNPAAETLLGPGVLGTKSGIGVSVLDSQDAPRGPKLIVCAAPHFFRDLHRIEDRLDRLFPGDGVPAAERPVIAEQEIGERDVMGAAVALGQVDDDLLAELLSGGPRLVALGAAGPVGGPGADSGPH